MTVEWRQCTWGDLATLEYGKALRDYKRPSGPTRVYGTNGPVGWTESPPLASGPGVVVGRKGAYRGVHFSPADFSVIDTAFYLKPKTDFDMRWAYYHLLTQDINALDSGSAIPSTSRADFYSLPVSVPPLAEQRVIAAVLADIDAKAAAEKAVAVSAYALLKRQVGDLLSEVEARVPLSSLADFVNGKALTKGATGTGRLVVRIAELNKGPGPSSVWNEVDVPDVHVARPGDVLFAWSGSLTLARWFRSEAVINQHIFKVIPKEVPLWLMWVHLRQVLPDFQRIAADKATTMGHIQRHHLDVAVPAIADEQLLPVADVAQDLWERALLAEESALMATNLRTALMFDLISGATSSRAADESAAA